VVTIEASNIEDPVAVNPMTAPFTKPPAASRARIVKVFEVVPSAFNVKGLVVVNRILAIVAVEVGTVGVTVTGVLASPPPPPQAVSTATSSTLVIDLINDIFTALFIP
jgi:hypothetical protein